VISGPVGNQSKYSEKNLNRRGMMNKFTAIIGMMVCIMAAHVGWSAETPAKGDAKNAGNVEKTDGVHVADNGTIQDPSTGLVWLKDADCFGRKSWADAMAAVRSLKSGDCSLKDGSKASAWRLPTKEELLERYKNLQAFTNVQSTEIYWSSNSYENDPDYAWSVGMDSGTADFLSKNYNCFVWPVR
jgi:hypothetical protein